MRKLTSKISLALAAVTAPTWVMAADIPTPPWRNVVSADDTTVFAVLCVLSLLLLFMIAVLARVNSTLASDKHIWESRGKKAPAVLALIGLSSLIPSSSMAAATSGVMLFTMTDSIFWLMVAFCVFLAFIAFALLFNIKSMMSKMVEADDSHRPATGSFEAELIGLRPIEEEKDLLMDHEYDGILELDNKLPPWWLYLFYFTIVFGVVYIPYYHFGGGGPSSDAEYQAVMAEAAAEKEARLAEAGGDIDENNVVLLTDAGAVGNGESTFKTYCVACHTDGANGSPTSVGPNLTDEYWINGGGIQNVFKTIKYGVPQKGMISWETQLSPVQMQEVASYIISMAGTDDGTGKEPQGEIWSEGGAAPAEDAAPADSTAESEVVEETAADDTATE